MSSPSLWRTPSYIPWLTSDTAIALGRALAGFALPLIALAATHDPAQAGVIGGVGMVISALAMLGGGVTADRRSRTLLLVVGAVVGLIIAASFLVLALTHALTFATLLVVEVVLAVRHGFFGMAGEAMLKDIVPAGVMGRAQAANQGRDAVINLAGGPLGGVLLAAGAWLIAVALVACQGIAAATAWTLRRRVPDTHQHRAGRENVWTQAREGFVWLFSRRDLRGVVLIVAIINLGVSTAVTTVIFSMQQRGHSPLELSALSVAVGVGMLAGALIAAPLVTRFGAGVIEIMGITVLAACIAAVPLVDGLWAVAGLLAVGAILIPAINAGMNGYFMVATPSELIGRASSAASLGSAGVAPLAPLIAGFGLSWFGRVPTLILAAALCLTAAILALSSGALRAIPAEAGWGAHAARFSSSPESSRAPD